MTGVIWAAAALAWALAMLRWLRVAQREHYLPWSVVRFAVRWWSVDAVNLVLGVAGATALGVSFVYPAAALGTAAVVAAGPLGLGVKGRTAPLRWTPRMTRLAAASGVVAAVAAVVGAVLGTGPQPAVIVAAGTPVLVDLALQAMAPIETRLSQVFVDRARAALARVRPTVVALTGSYGKTSTKGYVARLLGGRRSVLATPASFNNRLGLARAVNEHLAPGTEVFVAEMGTYGRGEIADMCAWLPPDVGVITAIGPVHLERFGSLEAIAAAKAEILAGARTAVLNTDDEHLARLVEGRSGRVVRCSVRDAGADVFIDDAGDRGVYVGGQRKATLADRDAIAGNVACAIGVLVALDESLDGLADALEDLPAVEHRRTVLGGEGGFAIIDDTYNSNPAGAAQALATLQRVAGTGRRVVVTPGMVELGGRQPAENRAFAAEAGRIATDLVVVGRTNRRALLEGAAGTSASVIVVRSREEAVAWVRRNLGPGDVVLYENDLPDHYP